jgi:hypothetical protein
MKKQLFLSLMLLIGANFTAQSQNFAQDTTDIKNVVIDFFELFVKNDLKYLDKHCTPTFELYESGMIWNNDTLRNIIYKRQTQKRNWERKNEFKFIKFNVNKDIAWVSYFNTAYLTNATTQEKRTNKWLESAVLVKKKEKWYLTQMHSTTLGK